MKWLHRENNMARQNQSCGFYTSNRNASGEIIASDVGVDKIDLVRFDKSCDLFCAEHAEGISYRNVKKILGRDKIEPVLPFVRRAKGYKNLVTASYEFAAQVDEVALAAAEGLCR